MFGKRRCCFIMIPLRKAFRLYIQYHFEWNQYYKEQDSIQSYIPTGNLKLCSVEQTSHQGQNAMQSLSMERLPHSGY